jgi:hypothetical protein
MYGAVDRFLVTLDSPGALQYLHRTLYVPHTPRERLVRAIRNARLRPTQTAEGLSPLPELMSESLWPQRPSTGTIYLRDVANSDRGRVLAFLFTNDEAQPYAVVKAQTARGAALSSLAREADALDRVDAQLPSSMEIPRVLELHRSSRGELLVTTAVTGRSGYVDLRRSLVPRMNVAEHFDAAARWLSAFHEAAGDVAHGDFWPGNVLTTANGAVSVIDWEHFSASAPFHTDLFHYPLTYALRYPWKRYTRLDAEDAFRRAFLERNHLSRAITHYLRVYAEPRKLGPAQLVKAFREYLASPHPPFGMENLPWKQFVRMADSAQRGLTFASAADWR